MARSLLKIGADGEVAHKPCFGVSDLPVCGATVGFAEISLTPQPPLLTRRGVASGSDYLPPPLIDARNSELLLLLLILSSRSSIASTVESGFRTFLKIQIRFSSSLATSNSSFRVPERLMSIA